jgi:hypothetical protein|tara:strand:- start:425 stop:574 length:150 start_codon:yes stop_codon:yes gene_type:complete
MLVSSNTFNSFNSLVKSKVLPVASLVIFGEVALDDDVLPPKNQVQIVLL